MHCEKCQYSTTVLCNWDRHLGTPKHTEPTTVKKCNLCNYSTSILANYKQHLENKIHTLLDKRTPTNYRTIVLDGNNINEKTQGRGTIVNEFKLLNGKYKFAFMYGPHLYVYTTGWNRYATKDIFIQLKEIYSYFEDYFMTKMTPENKSKYLHRIDDGSGRTEVVIETNGKKRTIKKGFKGEPILKQDLLNVIPILLKKIKKKKSALLYEPKSKFPIPAPIYSDNEKFIEFLQEFKGTQDTLDDSYKDWHLLYHNTPATELKGLKELYFRDSFVDSNDAEKLLEFIDWLGEEKASYELFDQWHSLNCNDATKPLEELKELQEYLKR